MQSAASDANNSDFILLAHCLAGDFSNQSQAAENPTTYAHIRVFFRPLPFEGFKGVWFYSEQSYDYDLWAPYRQGVHRLIDQGSQIYIENYKLQDSMLYAGAGHNQDILRTIPPERIERRHGCSMVFKREGEKFIGMVEPGKACLVDRNGRTSYLKSEVELTESSWLSWDRGFDLETDQQLWGSDTGPLKFKKLASFAAELPPLEAMPS